MTINFDTFCNSTALEYSSTCLELRRHFQYSTIVGKIVNLMTKCLSDLNRVSIVMGNNFVEKISCYFDDNTSQSLTLKSLKTPTLLYEKILQPDNLKDTLTVEGTTTPHPHIKLYNFNGQRPEENLTFKALEQPGNPILLSLGINGKVSPYTKNVNQKIDELLASRTYYPFEKNVIFIGGGILALTTACLSGILAYRYFKEAERRNLPLNSHDTPPEPRLLRLLAGLSIGSGLISISTLIACTIWDKHLTLYY